MQNNWRTYVMKLNHVCVATENKTSTNVFVRIVKHNSEITPAVDQNFK